MVCTYHLAMVSNCRLTSRQSSLDERMNSASADIAGRAFLTLLRKLRVSFLQDMVVWQQMHPTMFIFEDPLFNSQAFWLFEQNARASMVTNRDMFNIDLRSLLPDLTAVIEAGFCTQGTEVGQVETTVQGIAHMLREQGGATASVRDQLAAIYLELSRPQPGLVHNLVGHPSF